MNGTIGQIIRKHFQFKRNIVKSVERRVQEVTGGRENIVLIGVHVRRTDYAGYR